MLLKAIYFFAFTSVFMKTLAQKNESGSLLCECMEYWDCINSRGQPYSYCMYSNNVCCLPSNGTAFLKNTLRKTSNCGKKGFDSGKEGISEPGEWPWHVAMLEAEKELYICGGSLIDEWWVMTAAHCVDDYASPSFLKIRVGEHDVSSKEEPEPYQEHSISNIIVHPKFNNKTLVNDIALLKLSSPAKQKSNVNIICLPDNARLTEEFLSSKCFITGWGRKTENSPHSLILKEVEVPIWNQTLCRQTLRKQFGSGFRLPNSSFCGGAEGRDACDGDGGGGLFCQRTGTWYQVGIISFGIGCGRRNSPGVYTKVSSFVGWIYSTVQHNSG